MGLFRTTELRDLKDYWKRFLYLATGGNENDKAGYSYGALQEIQSKIYGTGK